MTARLGGIGRRIDLLFEPRDLWVGMYVSTKAIYVCPLPTLVIVINRGRYEGGRFWQ